MSGKIAELEQTIAHAQLQLQGKEQRVYLLEQELAKNEGLPARYQDLLERVAALQEENKALSEKVKDAEILYMRNIGALEKELYELRLEAAKSMGNMAE